MGIYWRSFRVSGADPGFPLGGGADPPVGAPTYDFVKFPQKLHEIKKIWAVGGRAGGTPLDPPLGVIHIITISYYLWQFFSDCSLSNIDFKYENNTCSV